MDQRLRLTRLIDSISRDPAAHRDSDAVLQQILGEGDAFFVQVGANDGEQNDPLIDVIRSNPRLRGLLVEPIPYYYDKLVQLHRERLSRINILRAGISNEARTIPFYYVDPAVADEMDGDGPPNRWAHGQGSTQRDVIVYWIRQNAFRGAHYRDNIPRYIDAIEADLDTLLRKSVGKQVVGAAIQRAGGDDVVASLGNGLDGGGDCCHARRHCQRGNATF